jgi:signal transduction histidine kinase
MMRRTDIAALAVEMGELFAPACEDAGQSLDVEAPVEPVLAWTHETLLRQAVGNLLHNAATHAGDGARVRLEVERLEDQVVRLSITDTGRGIPTDQLGRVQERFTRLEEARTTPGSGLGLALAAACAKLHGGRLMLEDNGPGLRAVLDLVSA